MSVITFDFYILWSVLKQHVYSCFVLYFTFCCFSYLNSFEFLQSASHFSILDMSSIDDSQSKSSTVCVSHSSLDHLSDDIYNLSEDEQLRKSLDINEDSDQDEGINNEPQFDDDEGLPSPVLPINDNNSIINTNFSVKIIHIL